MRATESGQSSGIGGAGRTTWRAKIQAALARWKIQRSYYKKVQEVSDIHEHLPTLREISRSCGSICEMGVRRCVSSWAFLAGLDESSMLKKELLCVDIEPADTSELARWAGRLMPPVRVTMLVADSRKIVLPHEFDLLFIDTLHVYGQLKAELWAHQGRIRRFIVLHDTETDRDKGEVLRMGWDARKMAQDTGMKEKEISQGLWPAVEEFLAVFPGWILQKHFSNNNGLTLLARREA
jgi:hypothetical protein